MHGFHFIRLTAERILVDADHFVIHENAAGFVAHLADVAADHQRGAKECPQCIVCLILDIAAAGQSNISFPCMPTISMSISLKQPTPLYGCSFPAVPRDL